MQAIQILIYLPYAHDISHRDACGKDLGNAANF